MILKKYFYLPFFLAALIGFFGSGILDAKAITADELRTQITALTDTIVHLQQQLSQIQTEETIWCQGGFNVNLKIGDRGGEITVLHSVLTKEGFGPANGFQLDTETEGGESVFGEQTAAAVSGFQKKYKDEILTPLGFQYGTGFVGKLTRAKLNKLYGCVALTPTPAPTSIPTPTPTPIEKQLASIWAAFYQLQESIKGFFQQAR